MNQIHSSIIKTLKDNKFNYIESTETPIARVLFNNEYCISISQIFLDEVNNRETYSESAIEIILLLNGKVCYNEELGYWDINRIDNLDELIEELNRLKTHFNKPE